MGPPKRRGREREGRRGREREGRRESDRVRKLGRKAVNSECLLYKGREGAVMKACYVDEEE